MTEPGQLVADTAHTTPRNAGPCTICEHAMLTGDRIARLADGSGWVHTACLSTQK